MSDGLELDLDARELAFCFVLGFVLGVTIIAMFAEIISEWVITQDQADRQRIREILAEMFAEFPEDEAQERPRTAELERDSLTVGSLTGEASSVRIAGNTAS